MSKKQDNPMAFPQGSEGYLGYEYGMTLRDYFAAKAMQSFIRTNTDAERTLNEYNDTMLNWITGASYKTADEMLKQRNKTE